MSGFLFLLAIDWIMRKTTTANNNTGIRWKMTTKLDELDFADDIALLSSSKDHMQNKLNSLNNYVTQTGLKINAGKTKVMWLNANNSQAITINEKDEMMWKILYILAQPSAKQEAQMKTSEEELAMLE